MTNTASNEQVTSEILHRLRRLENHQNIQAVITDYLIAVDDLSDVEAVLDCFTDDAVFDMSGINYPTLTGKPALREFFSNVFDTMTHHAHYATNFKLDSITDNTANCRTHVIGMGRTKQVEDVLFYLQYHLDMQYEDGRWKISRFKGMALMPLES